MVLTHSWTEAVVKFCKMTTGKNIFINPFIICKNIVILSNLCNTAAKDYFSSWNNAIHTPSDEAKSDEIKPHPQQTFFPLR